MEAPHKRSRMCPWKAFSTFLLVHYAWNQRGHAKHIHHIRLHRQLCQRRITALAQHLLDRRVHRINLVPVLLQVRRNIMARLARILRQTDNRNRSSSTIAQHLVNYCRFVHSHPSILAVTFSMLPAAVAARSTRPRGTRCDLRSAAPRVADFAPCPKGTASQGPLEAAGSAP